MSEEEILDMFADIQEQIDKIWEAIVEIQTRA